jgi:nucleotide-binding universal stress UspA family protein
MKALTQILVATDFSPASERALKTATGLAARFGAAITVTHVLEGAPYPYDATPAPWLVESANAHLDKTVAALQAEGMNAMGVLRLGVAWREICSAASELSPDVVVIGSQGRHGLPRLVLGSVAEHVVRESPVPVLTVHPSDDVPILGSIADRVGRILAPTDLSEESQRGVDAAVTLALALGAALTIVCVYELPSYAYYVLDEVAADAEDMVRRSLDELVARVRLRLPDAEGIVRTGPPWKGILDVARERRVGMVVLSTHGRRGLQHALVGSVAEKIVRLSPVPVLTIGAK